MKSYKQFNEGTWHAVPEKMKELEKLMQQPIPADRASKMLQSIVRDDILNREIKKEGGDDVRGLVKDWLANKFGNNAKMLKYINNLESE